MIELSRLAATVLLESLQASGAGHDTGLRLEGREGQFTLRLDSPGENDRVIRHSEGVVLIVDHDVEANLGEAFIDVEEGPKEYELVMRRKIREEEMDTRLAELENAEEFVVAGETSIYDEVIEAIARVAAQEVEGVASLGTSSIRRTLAEALRLVEKGVLGVEVEAGKKEAIVNLTLNVIYGFSIPQIIIQVRKNVAARLIELCGLVAKEINVKVVGIEFPERMPGKLE